MSRRRIEKDYTLGFNSGAALVGVTTLSGTVRNNYSGWVGTQITVGSSPVLVTDLGRWVKSGNTQSHTVKLVAASTGSDIPGASVTINTSGATAGQFAYATLAAPVELQANTTYYLVSLETNGGASWYEYTSTLSPASGLTIPGAVYGTGAPYSPVSASNQGYVPVGLKGVVTAPMITASSPSTTVRSNLTGWAGTKITVGTSPLVVTDLGRWVKSGNSQMHTLHMVRASDNVEVAGARVTVNTSGATSGQFLFGTLAAPVTLEANGVYYVLSQETNAGDGWYDTNTPVTPTIGMTLNASVLVDSTGAITLTTGSVSCGPVSFKATPATWTNSKETHYLYDGMLVVQERDASNNPQVSYTRGKDLSGSRRGAGGIGGLLAYTAGGVSQYYHSDGLGNVTALANVNNQISAAYNYDPYGRGIGSSGPMADLNQYRFSSREIHPGSGTYAYGYRFYDPNLQRWLNRDPIEENGGINLYRFVGNRPTGVVDPVGLNWWTDMSYGVFGWVWNPLTVDPAKFNGTAIDNKINAFETELLVDSASYVPSHPLKVGNTSAVNTVAQITKDATDGLLSSCPMPPMKAGGALLLIENGGNKLEKCAVNGEKSAGRQASKIDRAAFKAEREAYWKAEAEANPSKYGEKDLEKMKKVVHQLLRMGIRWSCITLIERRKGDWNP